MHKGRKFEKKNGMKWIFVLRLQAVIERKILQNNLTKAIITLAVL